MSRPIAQQKSTNVRYLMLSQAMRGIAWVSPALAAKWLERLFLATRRFDVPDRESAWLASATRHSFASRSRSLPAWSVGAGPTVLLVHGWEGRGSQLGAFIEPLVRRGYRVVTFDAPGHGQAEGRTSSLVEMADAVLDVSRELGPLSAVLAHSAGAAATTIAMSRGLDAARAVFVAPPADLGAFLEKVAKLLRLPSGLAHRTRRRIEEKFGIDWDDLRAVDLARTMTSPLLIVHDRDDAEVPFDNGERLARAWPGAELVATSGLGHRRLLRAPDVIARAVAFLNERHASADNERHASADDERHASAASGADSTSASTTRSFPVCLAR